MVWTFVWCLCFDSHPPIVLSKSGKKLKGFYIKVWRENRCLWLYTNHHLHSHVSPFTIFVVPSLHNPLCIFHKNSGQCILSFQEFTLDKCMSVWIKTKIKICYEVKSSFMIFFSYLTWASLWVFNSALYVNFHVGSFQKHERVGNNCTRWRSLVGYHLWGRKESDTTERLHFTSQTQGRCQTWDLQALAAGGGAGAVLKHRYPDSQRPVLGVSFHSIKETESLWRLKPVGRSINMNRKEILSSLFPI